MTASKISLTAAQPARQVLGTRVLTGLLAIAAIAMPLVVQGEAARTVCIYAMLMATLAVSYNLIFGYTGQLSLFHSAAFGVSAYVTAVLTMKFGWTFWWTLIPALGLAIVLAVGVGILCFGFKLREFYFTIVTMAMAELLRLVVLNWNSVTEGSLGLTTVIAPKIGSYEVAGSLPWYYLVLALLCFSLLVCRQLLKAWTGRCFEAIKLNDALAESVGVNVFAYKMVAFVTASALAALAGSFYAAYSGFVEPRYMAIHNSLDIIAMVLLGGVASFWGPVIGAIVLTLLPHVIDLNAELRVMLYGAILIAVILAMPNGIVGLWKRRQHAV